MYGKVKGLRSKEKTDKTWLEAPVSRAKKGCLRLLFERFDKDGYFVKFFLAKRLTTLFYDFTRTMSMSLLKITNQKEILASVLFTRFDFSMVQQVQAYLDAS